MRILKNDSKSYTSILSVLENDKVIVLPTDTIYGFSGKINTTKEKIQAIKGREENKPFIVLIEKPEDISLFSDIRPHQDLLTLWPGPLTIILPLRNSEESIALRCPGDVWLRKLIADLKSPLYSTSCNRSGLPPLSDIDEIEKEFSKEVALIVEDPSSGSGLASTIVSIEEHSVKLIRQGSLMLPAYLF